jgi:hypothetical protein
MTELHGTGIAAVLTADAELNPTTGFPASIDGLPHQGSYTIPIEHGERIRFHNAGGSIKIDELRRIVP